MPPPDQFKDNGQDVVVCFDCLEKNPDTLEPVVLRKGQTTLVSQPLVHLCWVAHVDSFLGRLACLQMWLLGSAVHGWHAVLPKAVFLQVDAEHAHPP